MIVKSLVSQLQNRFHVSASEIDEQDTHQIIMIGVAAVVPHNALADSLILRPLGVTYPIDLAWRKGLYVPAALRVFTEACREETAELNS